MIRAAGRDTADFVEWCILRADKHGPLRGPSAIRLLEKCGVEIVETASPRQTGEFVVGERVRCNQTGNANPENVEECEMFHNQIGEIHKVLKSSSKYPKGAVEVLFVGKVITFHGTKSGRETGLYREKSSGTNEEGRKKAMVEVVYFKDPSALNRDIARMQSAEKYMQRATETDSRSLNYYTGRPTQGVEGKNGFYFRILDSNQRDARPSSFNIDKGRLLYIGILNKRPGGWQKELAEMRAAIENDI